MLRWIMPLLAAIVASGNGFAADESIARHGVQRAARNLPAGLPRPHYKYRTTISNEAPYPSTRVYVRAPVVEEVPETLFTPIEGMGEYLAHLDTPLLPGSSTLPGYYGRAFSYDYQGPYYGGPYVGYWWRLPYACGVYGYC